jgi:hypothetical protein
MYYNVLKQLKVNLPPEHLIGHMSLCFTDHYFLKKSRLFSLPIYRKYYLKITLTDHTDFKVPLHYCQKYSAKNAIHLFRNQMIEKNVLA